jgi:hypothetical protein
VNAPERGGRGLPIPLERISFPDFEITWAGDCPWAQGFWLGSEDGRYRFRGWDGVQEDGPHEGSPSHEAINGIAAAGQTMAISSRSDVAFLNFPRDGRPGVFQRSVFHGGAHGVVSTESGSFAAPLGLKGLLLFKPNPTRRSKVTVLRPGINDFYCYKVASLGSVDGADVLACAARRGGFAVIAVASDRSIRTAKRINPTDTDFIDTCHLGSSSHPLAAAALVVDRSIYLTSNALNGRPLIVRFDAIEGRAYRILSADGHIFMLTSKGLYALVGLASRFLRGEPMDSTLARWMQFEAIDVSLTSGRQLLVVTPEGVCRIDVDSFAKSAGSQQVGHASGHKGHQVITEDIQAELMSETWRSLNEPSKDEPEMVEFAGVV